MVPEGWRFDRVDSFFELQRGFDLTRLEAKAGGVPVVSSSGISYYHNESKVAGPGVVTGRKGSVGPVYFIEGPFWPHDTSLWVRDFKDNLPKYVWLFLQNMKLEKFDEASSVPTLNRNNVHRVKVLFPPKNEQKKIVEIISEWDSAIANVNNLAANALEQKLALMHGLLSGRFRLEIFPEIWEWKKFSSVFARVRDKNEVGDTNVLTISARDGLVSQTEYFNKSVASEDVRGYTLLKRGDFAYNKSYSEGYPLGAFKPLERYDQGIVSSLYICFRLANGAHDHDFMRHYFEAGLFNREVAAIAQEGARNHGLLNVSVVDFFDTSLHLPGYAEQVAISKVINTAEKVEAALIAKREALRKEKAALMQQLLSGKRRVSVVDTAAA